MRQALLRLIVSGLLTGVAVPESAMAVAISFEVIDVPDSVPGDDLWQYSYRVSDFVPSENTAFEILFDPALYGGLDELPPFVSSDWDIITLQPDPFLPDLGRYSALALVDGASLADAFPVSFLWLGGAGTAPGAQPFELNEFDAQGNFLGTLATGDTVPVPEPHALLFVSAGLGSLAARMLRSRRRARRT